MTPEQIKEKVLSYKWEHWVDRPFGAFVVSLFKDGNSRKYMKNAGIDAELPAMLFQKSCFYKSEEVFHKFALEISGSRNSKVTIFDVVKNCESYRFSGLEKINELIQSSNDPIIKLAHLYEVLTGIMSYAWLAHGYEHLYIKKLYDEVPKYMTGNLEKNIGDICFPSKKSTHNYFEEALLGPMLIEDVEEKFSWIKSRDGFSVGFSRSELESERKRLRETSITHDFVYPKIPKEIEELVKVSQELVYFRTYRTDVLYELLYRSRPILKEVAKKYSLRFEELKNYSIHDLISGELEKYEYGNFSGVFLGEYCAFFHGSVLKDKEIKNVKEFNGTPAFKGKIQGIAKIAMTAHDTDKVNEGDILIAPTTAPSYIMAMKRAAAFVTDEGGITSHAAIVSREMKKPCIIGTKIATKVLKDGDAIEVDADLGIVRIIK